MKRDERLARLSREHTQALMLALRIRREVPDAPEETLSEFSSRIIAFWSAGLLPHFTAEGECLLARLVRHISEEDDLVRRLQRDHLHIEAFVAAIRDDTTVEGRRSLILELGRALSAHVRWEEEQLFPSTENLLSEEELTAVGADLEMRLPVSPLPWDES
ncbi:MAG: hemerythrin domain-containing protein [Myxococcales bacterium]|nr:hemerythrin domain-containing protein [Myxococcales bacterium]